MKRLGRKQANFTHTDIASKSPQPNDNSSNTEDDRSMTPLLVWGLFPRLLGLVYLIAFASLLQQVVPLAGADGVTPIKPTLRKIRADFPLWRCLLGFPTLLWIRSDDWCLRGLVVLGMGGAAWTTCGG